MPTKTLVRPLKKKHVPSRKTAQKPPERKATSRTAFRSRPVMVEKTVTKAPVPAPVDVRAPKPETPPKIEDQPVFVYVNGERRDLTAGTLATTLGVNVRHTDVAKTPVTQDERVVHGMKYLAG